MDVSLILDPLNEAQREAVAAPVGNLLVLAGAGSGKTRVLVHRMAWLMQVERVSPHGILAVTFTNKAAREMAGRIEGMMQIPSSGLWIGTFHGLANRLLKRHWLEAGLPQNFQILDSDDQLALIKRVIKEMALDSDKWAPREMQSFINQQKDEGRRARHVDEYGDFYQRTRRTIYQQYEDACQRGGMVDFAELLLRSHELWLNQPQILAHYQQRFGHILVDEFQDTNTIQYAWLRMLAGKSAALMAVGDDDQSIYGWRGARIENIQRLGRDFANTRTIRLEQNFRSTGTILQAANALIAHNEGRLGKEMWTECGDGDPIELYAAFNEQDEADHVVSRIRSELAEGGWRRSEIAILYRSNAQSRVLEEALLRMAIPYRIYGGLRFYDRLEIKHALAYLRLVANRNDDAALERVLNVPVRGIGAKSVDTLRTLARDQGCSLWDAIHMAAQPSTSRFAELVDTMAAEFYRYEGQGEMGKGVERVIHLSGLIPHFEKEKGEKGQTRIENLEELVNAAAEFSGGGAPDGEDERQLSPLQQFLDSAALDSGEGQAEEWEESIQLMTLHSSKGLEFPLVFLVGLEEGLFPHRMSAEDPGRLEEERRLCYVGVTRAMKKLFLSYAESRQLHGQVNRNPPSRFLRELPSELIREVRFAPKISTPKQYGSPSGNGTGFRLGQAVRHSMFGEGVILQFEGQGSSARVQVNFPKAGCKWLVLQFAKLEAA